MKTITIQIGNSDDKLTQKEWARFTYNVKEAVACAASEIHYSGASPGDCAWQNYCIVFSVHPEREESLREELKNQREAHKQDSLAWTEGETEFI